MPPVVQVVQRNGAVAQAVTKPAKRLLVIGDDSLAFAAGLQEGHPEIEFSAVTVLSMPDLEAFGLDPAPSALHGRAHYVADPCRLEGARFRNLLFDGVVLFLPGLSYAVPAELGTAGRPLFAFRTHLFVFYVLRAAKQLLRDDEGHLHLVWPDATGLMTSPCGAAGIEMGQLLLASGCCSTTEAQLSASKVGEKHLRPFLFGKVSSELPTWVKSLQIRSFVLDKRPIPVPLSVALQLPPNMGFVVVKGRQGSQPPVAVLPGAPLSALLVPEAAVHKERLGEVYGPRDVADKADCFGLVPQPLDEDALLSIPMEIFQVGFEELPHVSMLLRYRIFDQQSEASVTSLDVLDPRMPTRISGQRPPPQPPNPLLTALSQLVAHAGLGTRKRPRAKQEDWGGMHFFCPLTKICTVTSERMRLHMSGDMYKRMAASSPDWESSVEKRDLMLDLEEAEQEAERQRKAAKS